MRDELTADVEHFQLLLALCLLDTIDEAPGKEAIGFPLFERS